MTTLHIFSNRHIKTQVPAIKSGDFIYLQNSLSRKRWSLLFGYNNINENALGVTYVTQQEFFEMKETKDNMTYKFDAIEGNPPFSKNNKGKGGTSIYQDFAIKAMKLATVVTFVTPGTFENGDKFAKMREAMDDKGVQEITPISLDTFKDANIVRPCYWTVGVGNKKVHDFFTTPAKELFRKITDNTESFIIRSGRGDVSTSGVDTISLTQTKSHPHVYVDRVRKTGPLHVYCDDTINMGLSSPMLVFAQRGGMTPKIFFEKTASSYSQNVMAIQVKNETEFNHLRTLFQTNIYKFMLLQLSGGKTTTKAGFPAAFTKGKIEKLPALDLSIKWNDSMLKDKFDLSDAEMNIIKDEIS